MTTTTMKPSSTEPLTTIERRALAVRALVCEAALNRFLRGLPVRPLTRARIERALREMGMTDLRPTDDPAPEANR